MLINIVHEQKDIPLQGKFTNNNDPLSALGGGLHSGVSAVTPSMGVIGYMSVLHEKFAMY